jgi:hypothetical protein
MESKVEKLKMVRDEFGYYNFPTSVPYHTVPKILREYDEEGTRMYECEGGRQFIADTYDRMFVPVNTLPVKKKNYAKKGKSKKRRYTVTQNRKG